MDIEQLGKLFESMLEDEQKRDQFAHLLSNQVTEHDRKIAELERRVKGLEWMAGPNAPDEIKEDFFILLDVWWELYEERYHRVSLNKHESILDEFYIRDDLSKRALDWIVEWEKHIPEA
jgi:hypothetical protein